MTKRVVQDPPNVNIAFQLRVRRAVREVLPKKGKSKKAVMAEFNKGRE